MWEALGFLAAVPALIVGGVIVFLAVIWLLLYLWNLTMPDVFGLKTISYWQAFRLLLIVAILLSPGISVWSS